MNTNPLSSRVAAMLLLSVGLLTSCTSGATQAPANTPSPAATPNPQEALVGTWTATVTKEDILRVVPDFLQQHLCDNTGTFLWKLNPDGTFSIDQTELKECPKPQVTHIEDTWSVDGSQITTSKGTPDEEVYNWTVQGDALVLKRVSGTCVPCLATFTANPWERAK